MKKIVKLLILVFVCFLPVMVDAKVNLEFNKEYDNEAFLFEDEGIYYFLRSGENNNDDILYNIYDYDQVIGHTPVNKIVNINKCTQEHRNIWLCDALEYNQYLIIDNHNFIPKKLII